MNREQVKRRDGIHAWLKVTLVTLLTLLTVIGCGFLSLDGGHPIWLSVGFVVWTIGVCLLRDLAGDRREKIGEEDEEVRL